MYYRNFDDSITAKYGVVLEGWPLERFCNPSDIVSRTEISVLRSSFESGATRFRLLTQAELATWSETRFQAKMTGSELMDTSMTTTTTPTASQLPSESGEDLHENTNSADATSANMSDVNMSNADDSAALDPGTGTTTNRAIPAHSMHANADSCHPLASTTNFINFGVTSVNGTSIVVTKKPRKERSDKGKKRGKHTKAATQ
jgi:hypothetical protein